MVASLLGHSRKQKTKKTRAVLLLPKTQVDHMGCPSCMTQLGRRSHTQQHARARYGGNSREKDPWP